MARVIYEANTKVYWATTVASITAPTAANITAAVNLSPFIAKDGVAVNISTNNVDSATIDDSFDAQLVGSWGADVKLTMFRDDVTDTAWNLCVYGTAGFLIISRFGPAVVGSDVEVYPAEMHQPAMENSSANSQQRFVEAFAVTSEPELNAIVAA